MPSENDGVMIVLSSPSGAGKTTLVNLLSKLDNFEISISHTTRKPRPNEITNKDYYFVSEEKFERLIKNEEFLEYAKVFDNKFTNVVFPAPEGEESMIITPSFSEGIEISSLLFLR